MTCRVVSCNVISCHAQSRNATYISGVVWRRAVFQTILRARSSVNAKQNTDAPLGTPLESFIDVFQATSLVVARSDICSIYSSAASKLIVDVPPTNRQSDSVDTSSCHCLEVAFSDEGVP